MEKNCEGGGAVIANVLERPRRDTNGGFETEVTVTSERATSKSRKSEEREKKTENRRDASFGGAVRDSVPEDELSGGGARHSDAEVLKREKGGNDDVTSKFGSNYFNLGTVDPSFSDSESSRA